LSFGRFPLAILMAKGKRQKDKQYKGQRKNEERTNNIMAKGKRQKDKQYNSQRKTTKGQTI
jgi:tmRNA-binding protein